MTAAAPRVVLVHPENPANIGFVARVMANFGVTEGYCVGGHDWQGSEAERTGAPARATLESMRLLDSLEQAIAECTHVLGFTARGGRHRTLRAVQELDAVRKACGPEARIALLFGRESRGLEAEEVERCHELLCVPTYGMSSMNLSHAVAVALYEWRRGDDKALPHSEEQLRWASASELQRVRDKAEALLRDSLFREHPDHMRGFWNRWAARAVEARDLRVLEKILRHAEWLRERDS